MHHSEINKQLGNIDLYLLDLILKGYFDGCKSILDAGCGEGRNLHYFVNNGFEVTGIDPNPMAIKMAKMTFGKSTDSEFVVSDIESFDIDQKFDAIICSAVLHFAKDEKHCIQMLQSLSNSLHGNGILFIRMATDAGVSDQSKNSFNYQMPMAKAEGLLEEAGLRLMEPWKSVIVEGKRSMGVFVLSKI